MVFAFGVAVGIALGVTATYFALQRETTKALAKAHEYRTLWHEARARLQAIDASWGATARENPWPDLGEWLENPHGT